MASSNSSFKHISECFIQPHHVSEESKLPFHLTPNDLIMLSAHYIQKGLLFTKPDSNPSFVDTLLAKLKHSLSLALVHFYPLAGRLETKVEQDPHLYLVYVDCCNSPGAKFIHASLDMSVADILSPADVPLVVQSLFDHHKAVNHDGHSLSLLTAQVTELTDGVFIGLSMNHCLGDGTSYWNFFNTWSEIFQAQESNASSVAVSEISNPPVLERSFPKGHGPIISLPFKDPSEFVDRFESPQLRERMFHFSAKSLAKLKAKANAECNASEISTFQALSALLWRTITRARAFPPDQETQCRLAANNRPRLSPPLPQNYFGNSIYPITSEAIKAGELLDHGLGWAAWKLHEAVVNLDDQELQRSTDNWLKSPFVLSPRFFDANSVMMGSSPRFDMYRNEFGMGKAVALRSGYANKVSGKVSSFQGREAGSIDLEVCLPPETMPALEADDEFMEAASVAGYGHTT